MFINEDRAKRVKRAMDRGDIPVTDDASLMDWLKDVQHLNDPDAELHAAVMGAISQFMFTTTGKRICPKRSRAKKTPTPSL